MTETTQTADESIKEIEEINKRIDQFLMNEIQKPLVFEGLTAKLQQTFGMLNNPQIDVSLPEDALKNLKSEAQKDLETIKNAKGDMR